MNQKKTKQPQRIVFAGGGTAGHVTPNLAVIEVLQEAGWQISYLGSNDGVEKTMVESLGIPYHAISTGKLRRYFSWKNFVDPFKTILGLAQAYLLLKKHKTEVVFSKGGFVAFPVVVAAWLKRIPVIAHESDLSPGLANRLSYPFVNKICLTFAQAKTYFKKQDKIEVTGTPIREDLFKGDKSKGLELCGFKSDKPCLLVMGGSQGSIGLNKALRAALGELTKQFQVIHLCGKAKVDSQLLNQADYCQLEYANKELAHLFAAADFIVSRAGANSLYEILALAKPHVLVPLSRKVSRGDQILNAAYFKQQGISQVIEDEALTPATFIEAIDYLSQHKDEIVNKIKELNIKSATPQIVELIQEQLDSQKQT